MINGYLSELLDYAIERNMIEKVDEIYVVNRVLNLIGGNSFERKDYEKHNNIEEILSGILDFAFENGKLEMNTTTYRDILAADIMDIFTPIPSVLYDKFFTKYNASPKEATDYFYGLSQNNNYIMTERINKNILWKTNIEGYGDIDISINLSKPEKDPKEIALVKQAKQSGYPKCLLCKENMGFEGNASHPPRANHRIIPVTLAEEQWYLQYSPYGYFNEHCILLHGEHEPMKITRKTFERLVGFVEQYPHYFLGSNAGLPIVGGSILTHDHYQGGNYEFPCAKADFRFKVKFEGFDDIEAGVVNWIMSTIRIIGEDKERVIELANRINEAWGNFTSEENGVFAYTNNEPHNAITPIARKRNGKFEMDLILRNNLTSDEHPYGIFHAHEEYHYIKKENIGLIEAMGLAILPPRLTTQFGELTDEVKNDIGQGFGKILENCAVFKNNEVGNKGILEFVATVK